MRTRTDLTTPPGQVPFTDPAPDGVVERWVPGPDVPTEPRAPGRRRWRLLTGLAIILVVALVVAGGAGRLGRTQVQDPSMSPSAGQR